MWHRDLLAPAIALTLAASATAGAGDLRIRAGERLDEALGLLSAHSRLPVVFSRDVIDPGLQVKRQPPALPPEALLDFLLADHGLRCRQLFGRCVVERAPPARSVPDKPARSRAPEPPRLQPIQVSPSHYSLATEGASFLSAADIEARPHLADDVFRLARGIPGVAGGDIAAPFHVRGGQTDEVAVRLDGLELYKPFHLSSLHDALSIIDSNLIGGVDVYTAAWPSRLGGRMSGVIDIHSREVGPGSQHRLGVSAMNAFYAHDRGSADGDDSLLAAVRRGYLDVVPRFADPGGRIDPGYHDAFARYSRHFEGGHELSAHVLLAQDDILYRSESGDRRLHGPADSRYLWLRWQAQGSDVWSGDTLLAWTGLDRERSGFAFDALDANATVSDRRRLRGWRLSHHSLWQFGPRWSWEAGAEWRDELSDYDYSADVERFPLFSRQPERFTRELERRVDGRQLAGWVDGQYAFTPDLHLRAGLRHGRVENDTRGDGSTDPHLALAWQPRPGRQLRFGLARVSQAQRGDELAVEDGESLFFAPERAVHAVLSWEERVSARLRLRAELFEKRWDRLRPRWQNQFEPLELFPETESDRIRIEATRARSHGAEIGIEGLLDNGQWWARYVRSQAHERVDAQWVPRAWDQPHALHLGLDRRIGESLRLTVQVQAHSGWPTTEVGARRNANGQIEAVIGARNQARLPTYINVAARLSRTRALERGALTWYLEVYNLLDRSNGLAVNEFRLGTDADGNPIVIRENGAFLPRLPSFGVEWTF